MEIIDWIDAHWIQITSSGIGLLCVAWGISVIFKTVWGEWRHTIDTKRRNPFHKLSKGDKQCCNKHQPRL